MRTMNSAITATQLDDFYEQQRTGLRSFLCSHRAHCDGICKEQCGAERVGPFASGVGEEYGQDQVPRLAFLSSGPANQGESCGKTSQDYSEFLNSETRQSETNNAHWLMTKRHAIALLLPITEKLTLDTVARRICNINSVKCRQNNHPTDDPPKELFDNCKAGILAELLFLRPDILVIQGCKGWDVIMEGCRTGTISFLKSWDMNSAVAQFEDCDSISYEINIKDGPFRILDTHDSNVVFARMGNDHVALLLWTYHPSSSWINRKYVRQDQMPKTVYKKYCLEVHPLILQAYLALKES
jgi:hypothetical protein